MNEWDVIAFGDIDEDASPFKRVRAATSDEAVNVFNGRFAVAFLVKTSASDQKPLGSHMSGTTRETRRC